MFNLPQNESEIQSRAVFFLNFLKTTNAEDSHFVARVDNALASFNPALVKGVEAMIERAGSDQAEPDNSILSLFALERVASKMGLSLGKVEKNKPFPAPSEIIFVSSDVELTDSVGRFLQEAIQSGKTLLVKFSREWGTIWEENGDLRSTRKSKLGM